MLDLVVDRGNACASDIVVAYMISDHHAVHCQLAMRKPSFKVKDITYRKIRAIEPLSFASDITNSDLLKKPEHSLAELVCQYSQVLCELLDKHAPLKTRKLTVHCQITTTLSCCLIVSAITSKMRSPLSDVTLIVTRHSPHCA